MDKYLLIDPTGINLVVHPINQPLVLSPSSQLYNARTANGGAITGATEFRFDFEFSCDLTKQDADKLWALSRWQETKGRDKEIVVYWAWDTISDYAEQTRENIPGIPPVAEYYYDYDPGVFDPRVLDGTYTSTAPYGPFPAPTQETMTSPTFNSSNVAALNAPNAVLTCEFPLATLKGVQLQGGGISGWGNLTDYLNGADLEVKVGSVWSKVATISGITNSTTIQDFNITPVPNAVGVRLKATPATVGYLSTGVFIPLIEDNRVAPNVPTYLSYYPVIQGDLVVSTQLLGNNEGEIYRAYVEFIEGTIRRPT